MSVEQQQDNSHGGGAGRPRVRGGSNGGSGQNDGTLLARIRDLVLGDEYAPGTALSEVRLAEHFDVSRTPVREALKQLQVEGLVEIRPKVGTFVRQITRREIVEMFEVKEILEGMAARLMARRGQIPELDVLRANVDSAEIATRHDDSAAYAALVHEFHRRSSGAATTASSSEHYTQPDEPTVLPPHGAALRAASRPTRPVLAEHRRIADAHHREGRGRGRARHAGPRGRLRPGGHGRLRHRTDNH